MKKRLISVLTAVALFATCVALSVQTFAAPPEGVFRDYSGQGLTDAKLAELVESFAIPGNTTDLNLNDNDITDISCLAKLTVLETLTIDNNKVADLSALSELDDLVSFSAENNKISDLSPLKGLVGLMWLELDSNEISDISDLSKLKSLMTLNLENNKIKNISPLSDLTGLSNLYMGGNEISDISALSKLTGIRRLDLGPNQIFDISALKNMSKLWQADLSGNKISDLSALLGKQETLMNLDLTDNLLVLSQVNGFTAANPQCEVKHNAPDVPATSATTPVTTPSSSNSASTSGVSSTTGTQTEFILGDVDGDGKVTINDALEILKYLAKLDSAIVEGSDAWFASLITGRDKPTINDVLE
ncbi:MAG: hypothetical protein FWF82_07845, partial [Oscillospiraceae bacterium]|nr:hypothetical protein [Oscillospiraceae bacterium]